MGAYDKTAKENQYPKMKYKGVDYRVVSNADEEAAAEKDGFKADAPDGKVPSNGRDVMPKAKAPVAAVDATQAALDGLAARVKALEAEVFDDHDAKAKAKHAK